MFLYLLGASGASVPSSVVSASLYSSSQLFQYQLFFGVGSVINSFIFDSIVDASINTVSLKNILEEDGEVLDGGIPLVEVSGCFA